MSRSKWIRQAHRWLSIAFTLMVVANVVVNLVASGRERIALGVGLVTLVPLFLLLLTGLYLFVLPHAESWRETHRPAE